MFLTTIFNNFKMKVKIGTNGHHPTADSIRAVVSYWRKNGH